MRESELVRNNLPHLEERYFERMNRSMGDKAKILQFLPPVVVGEPAPKVLDVGAGSGAFSNTLSQLGYDVTALDASDDAVVRIRETYPTMTTATLLAQEAHELGENTFDAIICSSILHEAFSYSPNSINDSSFSSVARALDSFNVALKPGGVLVIRDGVLPNNWDAEGSITLLDGHEPSSVELYLQMCPFANGGVNTDMGNVVSLTHVGGKTFVGNVRSLLEFAFTYTWGLDSYHRETQELYALMTLGEYSSFIESHGFTVFHEESYLQEGYVTHLATQMVLEVDGSTNEWFDSNAIWVARKVS